MPAARSLALEVHVQLALGAQQRRQPVEALRQRNNGGTQTIFESSRTFTNPSMAIIYLNVGVEGLEGREGVQSIRLHLHDIYEGSVVKA